MAGRVVCACSASSAAVGVLLLLMFGPPAAAATPAITLAVSPTVVANGGEVSLRGTAPCQRVQITGSPGASGAAYVKTTATVSRGHYVTRLRLPHFVPDPSRPGLFDSLAFHAFCSAQSPEADSGIQVTGVELARTGSDIRYLFVAAVLALLIGIVCARTPSRGPRASA